MCTGRHSLIRNLVDNMKHKIYVDLDGVMANFEKAVVEHVGIHYWDRTTQNDSDRFWRIIDKVPEFYYNLEMLPGAYLMFKAVLNKYGNDVVEVLTGAPKPTGFLVTACEDKRRWVHEAMHPEIVVNTIEGGKNKYKFLEENPGSLLIDDYDRNIKLWIEHGGVGILHTDPDSTIAKLKLLELL